MFALAMADDMAGWDLNASGNWGRKQFNDSGVALGDFQDAVMRSLTARQVS
jgi:hypothetical protein